MTDEQRVQIMIAAAAIDNCEGIYIPYPTAKKMAEVSKALKELFIQTFIQTKKEEKSQKKE